MMRQLDGARAILTAFAAHRYPGRVESDPGFTSLIDVVGDTGRALALRDPEDLRRTLPAFAALLDSLEDETPFHALSGDRARSYAAGALWASSEIICAALGQWDVEEERAERAPRGWRKIWKLALSRVRPGRSKG